MVGVVSLCPGAPLSVCAAMDFSVDGVVLAGLSVRSDRAGVSSVVRVLGLKERCYRRLLWVCHSAGLPLERLRACWTRLVLTLFTPVRLSGRLVVIGDGLKVAKEGKKMPAVKKLHQSSENNSKATYDLYLRSLVSGAGAAGLRSAGASPERAIDQPYPRRGGALQP